MDTKMISRTEAAGSESGFFARVYRWMALGLFASMAASMWLLTQPALLRLIFTNGWVLGGLLISELILVIWLSARALHMSGAMAASVFLVYSVLNGLTLASIFVVYTGSSIATTFAVTAGTFLFFSVYGATTKQDLTSMGSLAMMGLIGVIIASLVNLFLHSTTLMWIATFVGIAVFLALIAYDTQKLRAIYAMSRGQVGTDRQLGIIGALTLYLDFINLFLLLLRIFGRQRD